MSKMSKVEKRHSILKGQLTEIDERVNNVQLVIDNLRKKKTEIENNIASHKEKFFTRDGLYYITGKVRYTAEYRQVMHKANAKSVLTIMDVIRNSGEGFDCLQLSDGGLVSQYWVEEIS